MENGDSLLLKWGEINAACSKWDHGTKEILTWGLETFLDRLRRLSLKMFTEFDLVEHVQDGAALFRRRSFRVVMRIMASFWYV